MQGKIYFLVISRPRKIVCDYSKFTTIYDKFTMKILKCLKPGRGIISYKQVLYIYNKEEKMDKDDELTFLC